MKFKVQRQVLEKGVKVLFVVIENVDNKTISEEYIMYRNHKVKELYEKYKDFNVKEDKILEGYHLLHAEFFNELAVEYTHDGVRAAVKRDGQCVCGAGYLGMRLEDGFHIQRHGAERKTGIYKLHQYQQYKYDPRIVAALYESTFLHC